MLVIWFVFRVEDGFRSACSSGDAEIIKSILSACTKEEKDQLLHTSSITGPPIFDAIISARANIVGLLVDQGFKLELEFDVNIFYPVIFRDKSMCHLSPFSSEFAVCIYLIHIKYYSPGSQFISFCNSIYPTAFKGCAGIVYSHDVRLGGWVVGENILSGLYLRNHKV